MSSESDQLDADKLRPEVNVSSRRQYAVTNKVEQLAVILQSELKRESHARLLNQSRMKRVDTSIFLVKSWQIDKKCVTCTQQRQTIG